MDDRQQWWHVFEMSGKVEDYLHYRQAVDAARRNEEPKNGTDSQRIDRERESRG